MPPDPGPRPFRWQALLQRAGEAVFVLDRRRRLLFANAAWEQLTGLPAEQAHGMLCRRGRPVPLEAPPEEVLAHVLTPPPEVLRGNFARARRLFPALPGSAGSGPRCWDVEFLPVRQGGPDEGFFILGRIRPLPESDPVSAGPGAIMPERLLDLRQRWASSFGFDLLASARPAMRRLMSQVRLASRMLAPVLIVGERGSGKETAARIIHYQGPEQERPFAALDCRRLPGGVLAGVLFGGVGRWGLGAVYLDEVDALPRDVQARLCEHLSNADAPLRVLAGCADAEEAVRSGRLLEDLYCLLGSLTLHVPPLRERREDLPRLVERLLAALEVEQPLSPGPRSLTSAAWEVVRHHGWPGNLTELRQVLADARGRAKGERIDAGDLPAAMRLAQRVGQEPLRAAPRPVPLEQTLEQVERRLIEVALRRARGQRALAAELLGIYRGRLLRRMKALGMATEEDEEKGE
jgi:transcriptional regulator with PAS, ATPase and Fis domain